jgi:hypothetical protein
MPGIVAARDPAGDELGAKASDFISVKVPNGVTQLLGPGVRPRDEAVKCQCCKDPIVVAVRLSQEIRRPILSSVD